MASAEGPRRGPGVRARRGTRRGRRPFPLRGRRRCAALCRPGGRDTPSLGIEQMTDDRLELAAAPVRALAERRAGRVRGRAIELRPARPQERGQPFGLRVGERPRIALRRYARRAEVRGGLSLESLDHVEGRRVRWRDEAGRRPPDRCRVAMAVVDQRLEGRVVIAAAPAPTRPVEGAGENAPASHLEIDLVLRRHRGDVRSDSTTFFRFCKTYLRGSCSRRCSVEN